MAVPAPRPDPSAARPLLAVLTSVAVAIALLSLTSLGVVLIAAMRERVLWSGFMTIALYGLPLAFVLMVLLIIANMFRRRSS